MSKFILTNDKSLYQTYKNNVIASVFELGFDYASDELFGLTTKKLNINNTNFFSAGNDFVLATGTMIFNKKAGPAALEDIYNNYVCNPKKIRDLCLGNYGLSIYKNHCLTVFCEESAIYDIFYYNQNGVWVISNSFVDMVKGLSKSLTLDPLNLMEYLSRYCIMNDETIFKEIKRLSGNQIIYIAEGLFTVINNDFSFAPPTDYHNNIQSIADELKSIACTFSEVYGSPAISMTGGLDSRMVLSSYLSAGSKPILTYGLGNSVIADSGKDDYHLDLQYSKRFDLLFKLYDWNETQPIDKYWDDYIEKYGEAVLAYGANKGTMDYFLSKDNDFVELGYLGEIHRDAGWIIRKKEGNITLQDLTSQWYLKSNDDNIIKTYPGLKDHLCKKAKRICEKYNMDPSNLSDDDNLRFAIEYYCYSGKSLLNFINTIKYCHYILSEHSVVCRSNNSTEFKKNAQVMVDVITTLCPDVMEIPVFSHWRYYNYDFKTKKLVLDTSNFKGLVTKMIPEKWQLYIRKLIGYHKMPKYMEDVFNNQKYIEFEKHLLPREVMDSIFSTDRNNSVFVIRYLLYYKLLQFCEVKF